MALSTKVQDYKDPRFCKDDVINRVNNYVTLHNCEKKLNTAHLEKVIKEGLIPLMKKQDSLFAKRYNSIMYGGSYYKGTKVGKAEEYDLDIIFCLPWRQDTLKFETPENKSGYVRIKLSENSKLPDWNIYHESQLSKFIENNYMNQNKFREWMESVISKTLNTLSKDYNSVRDARILEVGNLKYSISTKKSGPAFTFMIKVPEGHVIDVDFVACLEFSIPPPKRYKVFKNDTKKWLAVPKPLPDENGKLMWRLCFYQHEKELLKGPMKTVIRLLKKLRDTQNLISLVSYYIETLALHELEMNDSSLMLLPLTCLFMHMLKKLRDALKKHSIPFFWCKDMNLLDKLTPITMENIACRLDMIVKKIECQIETDRYIIASFILNPQDLMQMKLENGGGSQIAEVTVSFKGPDEKVIDVDLVPCLGFLSTPPKKAVKLPEEEVPNDENYETKKVKTWYVVAKPISNSEERILWRTSFDEHEREILKGQIKNIVRQLKKFRDSRNFKSLYSYIIETVALHTITDGIEFRKVSNTMLFMRMLKKLESTLKDQSLPFFWSPKLNLLASIKETEIQRIGDEISNIIDEIQKNIKTDPLIIAKFMLTKNEFAELKTDF